MRLEGWHVMVLLMTLVVAAVVVVAATLIVRWTLRWGRRKDTDGRL
jgi:Flp pilus assembly protein TadB